MGSILCTMDTEGTCPRFNHRLPGKNATSGEIREISRRNSRRPLKLWSHCPRYSGGNIPAKQDEYPGGTYP